MQIVENSAHRVVVAERNVKGEVSGVTFMLVLCSVPAILLMQVAATQVAPGWAEENGLYVWGAYSWMALFPMALALAGLTALVFAIKHVLFDMQQRLQFDLVSGQFHVVQRGLLRRADREFPVTALVSHLTPAEGPDGSAQRIWSLTVWTPWERQDLAKEIGLTDGEDGPTGYKLTAAQAQALQPLLSALAKLPAPLPKPQPQPDALPA